MHNLVFARLFLSSSAGLHYPAYSLVEGVAISNEKQAKSVGTEKAEVLWIEEHSNITRAKLNDLLFALLDSSRKYVPP